MHVLQITIIICFSSAQCVKLHECVYFKYRLEHNTWHTFMPVCVRACTYLDVNFLCSTSRLFHRVHADWCIVVRFVIEIENVILGLRRISINKHNTTNGNTISWKGSWNKDTRPNRCWQWSKRKRTREEKMSCDTTHRRDSCPKASKRALASFPQKLE